MAIKPSDGLRGPIIGVVIDQEALGAILLYRTVYGGDVAIRIAQGGDIPII